MKTLYFHGSSDDTFGGYDECGYGDDHDDCANGSLMAFKLTSGDEGLIITGRYAPKPIREAVWLIGVSLLEEDKPLPNWPMRWETADNGYSPCLVIECPDDVEIEDITNAR